MQIDDRFEVYIYGNVQIPILCIYIGVKDQSNYQIAGSYRSYSKVIEFYLVVVWIKQIW